MGHHGFACLSLLLLLRLLRPLLLLFDLGLLQRAGFAVGLVADCKRSGETFRNLAACERGALCFPVGMGRGGRERATVRCLARRPADIGCLLPRSPPSRTLTLRGTQIILVTFPWVTKWLFLWLSLQNFYLNSGFFVCFHLLNFHIDTSDRYVLLFPFTDGKTEVQGSRASILSSRRQYGFLSPNPTSF